jgi:phage-related protein
MSDVSGKLALFITANAGSFNKALDDVSKKFNKFNDQITGVGQTLSLGLTLPLIGFATKAVSEFQDTAKALGQVEAGLRSTGNAAGFTAEQLGSMAKSLQGTSIFSDDQILEGVTAQLLTFTNISGAAFEGAQKAAVDLSSRLGQDLQSSAIQLGKALNDPVKGLTALSRVGVQFTEDQKALIQGFVDAGDVASAQKVILDELNVEFGGSAQAALDASGGLVALRNAFNDVAETVGGIIAPVLKNIADVLKGVAEGFNNLDPATQRVIVVLGGIAAAIGPALLAFGKLASIFGPAGSLAGGLSSIGGLFTALTGPIGLVVAAVAGAAALIITNWDSVVAYFTSGPGGSVFDNLKALFNELYELVTTIFGAIYDAITSIWSGVGDEVTSVLRGALDVVMTILSVALEAITALVQFWSKIFEGDWQGAWDVVKVIFQKALNFLIQFLADSLKGILGVLDDVFSFFGAEDFIDPAIGAVQEFADFIKFEIPASVEQADQSISEFTESLNQGIDKNIVKAQQLGDELAKAVAPARVDVSTLTSISSTGTDTLGVDALSTSTGPSIEEAVAPLLDPSQLAETEEQTRANTLANDELEASYIRLGQTIGATFESGGETIKDYMKNVARAVANAIRSIIKAFAAQAVAGYISKVVSTLGPLGLALAAAAPAVVGGLFDALIPAFAQGGMVTGPQLAMVGDNRSGKEAIIPFERMGEFLGQFGGGQQVVVLETKISGNDLLLVQRSSQSSNVRQYGRTI